MIRLLRKLYVNRQYQCQNRSGNKFKEEEFSSGASFLFRWNSFLLNIYTQPKPRMDHGSSPVIILFYLSSINLIVIIPHAPGEVLNWS